jgi:hypothetical protein
VLLKERNDPLQQVTTPSDDVLAEVLPMVVVPLVHVHPPHTEEADVALRGNGGCSRPGSRRTDGHLVAGCVAFAASTACLPHEADGEASLSVYETDHPATELDQPFLLIVRITRHVVTMVNVTSDATW